MACLSGANDRCYSGRHRLRERNDEAAAGAERVDRLGESVEVDLVDGVQGVHDSPLVVEEKV